MCACERIPEGPSLRYPRIWPPKAPGVEARGVAPLACVTQSEARLGYTSAHSSFHSFNLGACALCRAQCFFPWEMRNLRCLSKAGSGNLAGPRALPFLLASPHAGGCGRGPEPQRPGLTAPPRGSRLHIHDLGGHAHPGGGRVGSPSPAPASSTAASSCFLFFMERARRPHSHLAPPNHLTDSRWKDFGNYLFQLSCFQSRLG